MDGSEFGETSKKLQTVQPVWDESFSVLLTGKPVLELYVFTEPADSNNIEIIGTATVNISSLSVDHTVHSMQVQLAPQGILVLNLVLVPLSQFTIPVQGKYRVLDQPTSHQFQLTTFHQPRVCSFCDQFLWGVGNQGMRCILCSMVGHKSCVPHVLNTCRRVTESYNTKPKVRLNLNVEHVFVQKTFYKPTFCSHCGELLVGLSRQGYQCRQCGDSVHQLCMAVTAKNCQALEHSLARHLCNIGAHPHIANNKLAGWSSFRVSRKERKFNLDDLRFRKLLKSSKYSSVYLAEYLQTGKLLVVKTTNKSDVMKDDLTEVTMTEKYVLSMGTRNNFINRLFATFQTPEKLYFMMEYHPGGDLLSLLQRTGKFSKSLSLSFAAELCVGLQFLHSRDIIHRDIKLENILLDQEGHIKITDFGMSKLGETAATFCGTPSHIAPEIILGKTYTAAADWWCCGICIFQMLSGYSPFHGEHQAILFRNILQGEVEFPYWFTEEETVLLESMLTKDPDTRFGKFLLLEELSEKFSYFKSLNWDIVRNRRLVMPDMPHIRKEDFKDESVSIPEEIEEESITKGFDFKGFSFYNDSYEFEDDLSNI